MISAPLEEVRAFLLDPEEAASLTPDVESVEVLTSDTCDLVRTTKKGLLSSVEYVVKRCYADDGVQETLVESEDFTAYEASYTLTAVDGGTKVVYDVTVGVDMPVPDWAIRMGVERSTAATMEALAAHFD